MIRTLLLTLFLCLAAVDAQPQAALPLGAQAVDTWPTNITCKLPAKVNQKAMGQAKYGGDEKTAMFPHLFASRIWISGQANFIFQAHGPFHSPYQGTNSLVGAGETANSRVLTLYTGVKLPHSTEFIFDLEETGGGGLSQALGMAGSPTLTW